MLDGINHCVQKVTDLVNLASPSRRELLQLGYNLGRLSELTRGGREPFWDRWKVPVEGWDQPQLMRLAQELQVYLIRDVQMDRTPESR